jgi:hypothetical protein
MTPAMKTPHLNPLPTVGERQTQHRVATGIRVGASPSVASIRLSLFQRERIEVRDWFRCVVPVQTRLRATRRPVPSESDDSKIATLVSRAWLETARASGHAVAQDDNCVPHHPTRSPASLRDSKNQSRNNRSGVVVEPCNQQNSGCEDAAKGAVPIWLGVSADNEHGSRDDSNLVLVCSERQIDPSPQSSPQSRGEAEKRAPARLPETIHRGLVTNEEIGTGEFDLRGAVRLSLCQRERIEVRDCFT